MARHSIPKDPDHGRPQDLDVILDDTMEPDFDVTAEEVPKDLPDTYQDRRITWVSNFRVQKKPGRQNSGKKLKYSIELDRVGDQLVYYDAAAKPPVILLTTRRAGNNNNRIQADLSVDDPPIGHT
jgi:hypothetical protein